jgi:dinuclear metal center YbgI/SA1388 family protein
MEKVKMTTVADILKLIETFAPTYMKEPWDNVGLNCGRMSKEVRKILVALDASTEACHEAAEIGADLLLTHHPLLFHALPTVTDESSIARSVMILVKNNISHFCAHTNLDAAEGGVNDVLAEVLGLENAAPFAEGLWGVMRAGEVREQSLQEFLAFVKEKLHTPGLRYCDTGKPVHKVAVGGGGCAGGWYEALKAGCDTFVTSDPKYNEYWDAYDQGLNMIDAGHFYTENPVCYVLAAKLREAFPALEVKIAESHTDCLKYY